MPENVVFVGDGARIKDIARFMACMGEEGREGDGELHRAPLKWSVVTSRAQRFCNETLNPHVPINYMTKSPEGLHTKYIYSNSFLQQSNLH